MIRISAFADEVSPVLEEQIAYLRHAGVRWSEVRFVDGRNITALTEAEAAEVRRRLDAAGIGVSAIASPIGKYPVDAPFEPHLELFRHTVRLARILGTKLIRVFSFYAPEGRSIDDCRAEVCDRLRRMAAELDGTDIRMAHENESHIFGHSAANCAALVSEVASESMMLAYDPANFVWGESIVDNVESCWPLMKPHVGHIHIKDWKAGSKDLGSLPGDGDGQIEKLVGELAAMRYDGFVTLEPHMSSGGQFGGATTPEQFDAARGRVRGYCRACGLEYE